MHSRFSVLALALGLLAAGAGPVLAADQAPKAIKLKTVMTGWYAFDGERLDNFKLRRVNVYVSGEPLPNLSYTIMIQPHKLIALPTVTAQTKNGETTYAATSNGDRAILQDAFASYKLSDTLSVTVGQFRPPLSTEARNPAFKLPLAQRALFLESNPFGFYRDKGVEVAQTLPAGLKATVGVFNGEGTNANETNHQKDAIARLDYSPLPALRLSASALRGTSGAAADYKDRWDASADLDLGAWTFSAETLFGTDGPTMRLGWYGQGAWRFAPEWQGVLRHELWDADRATPGDQRNTTLGLNYLMGDQGSKLGLNLIHEDYTGPGAHDNLVALLQWQVVM